jgi:hypothetical protein
MDLVLFPGPDTHLKKESSVELKRT